MKSHCHTCKFATWDRTPTGRISKTVPGRCTWSKTVMLPTCGGYTDRDRYEFVGGAIWHKDDVKCQTYVRATK